MGNMETFAYHGYKQRAMEYALDSYSKLSEQYDRILIEGAGSPAEVNLRANDIANMGFAERIDCPVILVGDIDRGGVFAHFVGTLELLSESERKRVIGFVINRFRGDVALLEPGLRWLETYTGKAVLGVIPFLQQLYIEAEDAINTIQSPKDKIAIKVVVPILPRFSNHTDLDALRLHPQVSVRFVPVDSLEIPPADLVVLPGSKSVRYDLSLLLQHGWDRYLARHLRYGGKVIGICGGMQMLGQAIHDPLGIEGASGSMAGFGLMDFETTLTPEKTLANVSGKLFGEFSVKGYEIHCGVSEGSGLSNPAIMVRQFHASDAQVNDSNSVYRPDGALSADNQILCTYVHGLFDDPASMTALLSWAGLFQPGRLDTDAIIEEQIDRLADAVDEAIDIDNMLGIIADFHTKRI